MLNDDDNVLYFSIDQLMAQLKEFIDDKISTKFVLTKFQAQLIYSEIISLCEDITSVDEDTKT
jgi:hypothetical protein